MKISKKNYYLEEIPCQGDLKKRVLCVHGLNQRPEALKFILKELSAKGVQVFLLHLPGHNKNSNHGEEEKVVQSYLEATQWIKNEHGSLDGYLGYSYGGLIGVSLLDQVSYDRMILLAPALSIRGYTHALKIVLPLLSRIYSVPIGKAKYENHYRYHKKGVPSSVYRGFFNIYKKFKANPSAKIKQTQAMVFCHRKDELINFKKLKTWVEDKTSWSFHEISNRGAEFSNYNHLCFDEVTLGKENYQSLRSHILNFLS